MNESNLEESEVGSEIQELDNIPHELKCNVCMSLFYKPLLFECGHSFCTECHVSLDEATTCRTFTLPVFKCPLCRYTTHIPWTHRIPNVTLSSVCETLYPKEIKKLEEGAFSNGTTDEETDFSCVNLSELSCDKQSLVGEEVYTKLMPLLYQGASEGLSHLTISESKLVRQIEICIQSLTKKLFNQNNVFKVSCTPHECKIFFSRCSESYSREFVNENHHSDEYVGPSVSPARREQFPQTQMHIPTPLLRQAIRTRGRRELRERGARNFEFSELRDLVRRQMQN
jgi:hypothetical protein